MIRLKTRNDELIMGCLSDMALHQITVDDLFLQTSFSNDDRAVMLEVIQSVKQKYVAPRPPARPLVTNGIVLDLYQDEGEVSDGQLEKEVSGSTKEVKKGICIDVDQGLSTLFHGGPKEVKKCMDQMSTTSDLSYIFVCIPEVIKGPN